MMHELFVPACDGNENPISFVLVRSIMVVTASLSSFSFISSFIF